jgi:chemotaxis protein histidine kinase CheA
MSIEVSEIPEPELAVFANNLIPIHSAPNNRPNSPDSDSSSESNSPVHHHVNVTEQLMKHQQMIMPPMPPMPILDHIIPEGQMNYKKRSLEEEHCIVLKRNSSTASKSSNTKYKCLYCNFEFVGGPQKIRVHLTGKRENGTRLSKCEKVPEEIRALMESRMRSPKELNDIVTMMEENEPPATNLPSRSVEENHCYVLERSASAQSKSSNTRYKCIYCRFKFVGGPQKIRVHLTGLPEGGTRVAKCPRAPPDVVAVMENRRKASKIAEGLSGPPGGVSSSSQPPIEEFTSSMVDNGQQQQQQQQHPQQQVQQQQQQQHPQQQQQIPMQHQQQQHQQQLQQHQVHHLLAQQQQQHHNIQHHEAAVAVHQIDQQQQAQQAAHQYHLLQQHQHQQQQHHLMATNPQHQQQLQMQIQQQLQLQQAQQQHLQQQQHLHQQQLAVQQAQQQQAQQQAQAQAHAAQQAAAQQAAAAQAAAVAAAANGGGSSHIL